MSKWMRPVADRCGTALIRPAICEDVVYLTDFALIGEALILNVLLVHVTNGGHTLVSSVSSDNEFRRGGQILRGGVLVTKHAHGLRSQFAARSSLAPSADTTQDCASWASEMIHAPDPIYV